MNDDVILLAVGQPYPIPVPEEICSSDGGASANLLHKGGSFIGLCLPDITESEVEIYTQGELEFGIWSEGSVVFFLLRSEGKYYMNCPYDACRIPDDVFIYDSIDEYVEGHRLLIDLHLVDTRSGLLRGLRSFTISPDQTLALLQIAFKQRSERLDPRVLYRKQEEILTRYTDRQLARHVDFKRVG